MGTRLHAREPPEAASVGAVGDRVAGARIGKVKLPGTSVPDPRKQMADGQHFPMYPL